MVCHLSMHSMHATVWQGRSTVPLSDLIAFVCLDDKKEPSVEPPSAQVYDCHGRVRPVGRLRCLVYSWVRLV